MSQNREKKRKFDIPIWRKANLSIEEAAAYSGIGMAKLYEMTESEDCPFVLWIGSRRMIKRKAFDEYIERQTSVYKGYKQDKIEMRGDRAEMSDFPLYLNTVAGGLDRRDQAIGGFSFVVKIYAVPVVEIIG